MVSVIPGSVVNPVVASKKVMKTRIILKATEEKKTGTRRPMTMMKAAATVTMNVNQVMRIVITTVTLVVIAITITIMTRATALIAEIVIKLTAVVSILVETVTPVAPPHRRAVIMWMNNLLHQAVMTNQMAKFLQSRPLKLMSKAQAPDVPVQIKVMNQCHQRPVKRLKEPSGIPVPFIPGLPGILLRKISQFYLDFLAILLRKISQFYLDFLAILLRKTSHFYLD